MVISEELKKKISSFKTEAEHLIPNLDKHKLEETINFAFKAHAGQNRMSGEPYFYHCLAVADIVLEISNNFETILSALLHDVLEDTQTSKSELEQQFGMKVTQIVEQITEISKLPVKDPNCIVCRTEDKRVLYIKIADRLHNMRTLSYLPREKQLRIARATLDVYAKIAGALNLGEINRELENLAFKYWDGKSYEIIKKLANILGNQGEAIKEQVKTELLNSLKIENFKIENIMSRDKSYYSAYNKIKKFELEKKIAFKFDEIGAKLFSLTNKDSELITKKVRDTSKIVDKDVIKASYDEIKKEYKIDFWEIIEKINDFTGMRIIVSAPEDIPEPQRENIAISDCYRILHVIRNKWPEIVFRDYIKPNPKEYVFLHGRAKLEEYKSLHITVNGPGGTPIEFHIHTQKMQEVAEKTYWYYKENIKANTPWLIHLKKLEQNAVYTEGSKIYAFTPHGDYKELPAGSTPVDFAFAVHTEIGNRCVSAKVNGKIVPLRTLLKTGDIVEIITSKTAHPSRDWLNFSRTSRARNKIHHYLKTVESEQYIADGRETLIRELRAVHLNPSEIFKSDKFTEISMGFGLSNISDLFINIALGKISPKQVSTKLSPQPEIVPERAVVSKPELTEEVVQSRDGIKVKGVHDILIRFAKCCNPVPGDAVIGFITRGRGVSIHKRDCSSLVPFLSDMKRVVNVDWDMEKLKKHLVPIKVEMVDRPGTLAAVLAEIATLDVNVYSSIVKKVHNNRGTGIITLEITQVEQLNTILDRLRQIPNVVSVARTKRMK